MFNKLFSGQGSPLVLVALAAAPFMAVWLYFKVEPLRPAPLPAPAAVAVDTSAWYNPFSWGRDHAANLAANEAAMRSASLLAQAREADAADLTSIFTTLAILAAVVAVAAKAADLRVPHPQVTAAAAAADAKATEAANRAADAAIERMLAKNVSSQPAPEEAPARSRRERDPALSST